MLLLWFIWLEKKEKRKWETSILNKIHYHEFPEVHKMKIRLPSDYGNSRFACSCSNDCLSIRWFGFKSWNYNFCFKFLLGVLHYLRCDEHATLKLHQLDCTMISYCVGTRLKLKTIEIKQRKLRSLILIKLNYYLHIILKTHLSMKHVQLQMQIIILKVHIVFNFKTDCDWYETPQL